MMTWPSGVRLGSTTTLNDVEPTKARSRRVELIGSRLPLASTLVVLSNRFQVAPPSWEIRKPTPVEPASPSPVEAITSDFVGSFFRGKTAMPPTLMALVGPKSVSGTYVGPFESVVRKLVVFQMPPLAPPTNTVLPEGSEGSTARPPIRPVCPVMGAGPTAVQVSWDSALVGSIVKIRKLAWVWSAVGSPRPEVGWGFSKESDQLFSVPVRLLALLSWSRSVHVPPEGKPANAFRRDCCGLNELEKNGANPCWI